MVLPPLFILVGGDGTAHETALSLDDNEPSLDPKPNAILGVPLAAI